jgi:hypothetical protein
VAQRFWSDGADKERLVAIPDGTTINTNDPTSWELPIGGVSIKNFYWNGQIFETRFFVRHNDGSYAGYTYEWSGSNVATLVPASGSTRDLGGIVWGYPSRSQCLLCHTAAAGRSLGLETRQLNIDAHNPATGQVDNQLARFADMGLLDTSTPLVLAPFPDIADASVPLDVRAESYLHVNCMSCHRGGQSEAGRSTWDARFDTLFENKALCDAEPFASVSGSAEERLVTPGAHELSTVWLRMHQRVNLFMPPLGSVVPDTDGADLLQAWITGIDSCPLDRVEAEAYDRALDFSAGNAGPAGSCSTGGDVDAEPTSDPTGGSCNIGWTQAGEWLEYDISVPETAVYDIVVRLASDIAGSSVRLVIDGSDVSGALVAPGTGWQSWGNQTFAGRTLAVGSHTVRLEMVTGNTNVNYLEFQKQ